MKPHNEKFLTYLKEQNLLHATPEEIQRAKVEYRKAYKKEWHRHKKQKYKSIQIHLTEEQWKALTFRAQLMGLCKAQYVKEIVIQEQETINLIPHKQVLQKILQLIAMASIQSLRDKNGGLNLVLDEAEILLTKYLNT
jgi:hypothetical protein